MSAGKRKALLNEAAKCVTQDRNSSYGEPEDNFQAIAEIWQAQGMRMATSQGVRSPNASDVALLMAGLKLARLKHNPNHRDGWVDGIGYLACGGDIALPDSVPEGEVLGATEEQRGVSAVASKPPWGWVSGAQCGFAPGLGVVFGSVGAKPHEGHSFGVDNSLWCDGYIAVPIGQPKLRPIKDMPQV